MAIEHSSVQSSTISSIGYDAKQQLLEVCFRDGSLWEYSGVSIDTWEMFRFSRSIGKAFHAYIRKAYPARKIRSAVISG